MNKKLAAVLSGGAVLVLTLSGCSDDGEKVDAWAKTFCDQAQPQFQKQANANELIKATAADSKPAEIQAADSKAFADIAAADRALAKAVESAGAPPVDNGETIQQDAIKELNAAAVAYEGLKKQVDALDTANQQKFADGLKSVADNLAKIQNMDQNALNKVREGELGQALAKQPGCKSPKPSVPPAAGSSQDAGSAPSKAPSAPSATTSKKPSGGPSKSAE
ncbi:small secreted protein [Streptomyces sp. ms191]|uniref:small secreted protein n=1 Tax=unclassified Streptomyces TaxID=2593676 RepID=UPI0011CE8AD8|nr:small secreted protein [Streptomyces sp. ms191]TXS30765.1 small secreted protein [Streptomyces sp. ms191]